jgi:cobalt-precorrin 5A hydrolase
MTNALHRFSDCDNSDYDNDNDKAMNEPAAPHRGRLIGCSLGPGDPDLITRRAWTALQSDARWIYPVTGPGADSYALAIVRRAGLPVPPDALALHFPMTSDPAILALAWARAGAQCAELLAAGRDLLFLVEGDASTYSTFGHLARAVRGLASEPGFGRVEEGVEVAVIPGVSSYHAAAARIGAPLVEEDDTLAIMPAAYGIAVIDRLIDTFDTLVLLKVKPLLDPLLDLLERRGLIDHACFVEKVGAPDERVVRAVATLRGASVAYLSLLLVRNPGRVRDMPKRGGSLPSSSAEDAALRIAAEAEASDAVLTEHGAGRPVSIHGAGRPVSIAVLAITRAGIRLAGTLVQCLPGAHLYAPEALTAAAAAAAPGACTCYRGPTRDLLPTLFANGSAIVAIFSIGVLVRLIAPHLRDKYQDPAVVALDETGRFVIPVLSGHLGGANALAGRIAAALGAAPVLTTASDCAQTLAVDLLGRELGWTLDASPQDLLRASAAMVNAEPVALVQEAGSADWWTGHANGRVGPLPANLHCARSLATLDLDRYRALLWISDRPLPLSAFAGFQGALVSYRPGGGLKPGAPDQRPAPNPALRLALGLGCDRGTSAATLERAVAEALAAVGAAPAQVAAVASIELKADEAGLAELAANHGWQILFYSAAQLAAIPVPNPSETVRRHTGTPSVSAAAALLAAGPGGGSLLLEKHKVLDAQGKHATVSIARISDD